MGGRGSICCVLVSASGMIKDRGTASLKGFLTLTLKAFLTWEEMFAFSLSLCTSALQSHVLLSSCSPLLPCSHGALGQGLLALARKPVCCWLGFIRQHSCAQN